MLLIHVSYAKAGTTSLQKHFFSALDNAIHLGRNYPKPKIISSKFWHKFVKSSCFEFNELLETLQCYLHDDLNNYYGYAQSLLSENSKITKRKTQNHFS